MPTYYFEVCVCCSNGARSMLSADGCLSLAFETACAVYHRQRFRSKRATPHSELPGLKSRVQFIKLTLTVWCSETSENIWKPSGKWRLGFASIWIRAPRFQDVSKFRKSTFTARADVRSRALRGSPRCTPRALQETRFSMLRHSRSDDNRLFCFLLLLREVEGWRKRSGERETCRSKLCSTRMWDETDLESSDKVLVISPFLGLQIYSKLNFISFVF